MISLSFILKNKRFLAFGLACTLASNFGQTFFIALFSVQIRHDFNLGHAEFGGVYSLATLASAAIILGAGRLIDRVDLRVYTAAVFIGLAFSAWAFSIATSLVGLGLALVGLRLFGQGLLRHTAVISQARYFEQARGRAMSIVGLGYPIAEATFPALLLLVLAFMQWREAWLWMAVYIGFIHLPLVMWLLKGHGIRHRALMEKLASEGKDQDTLTSRTITKDWRFQLMIPAALMGPFMMTGLLFHHLAIVDAKGWDISLIAISFPAFPAATIVASLVTGVLVDRYGPGRILPLFVWPLVLALICVATLDHPTSMMIYLALGGLTVGSSSVLMTASWAQTFGVQHLGKVRSLTTALAVLSTAISPVWMGSLMDNGWTIESIAIGAALITSATGLLVMFPAGAMRQNASH